MYSTAMSYILSALKKAEQERLRGSPPDVLTSQTIEEPSQPREKGKSYIIAITAAVLLLGLGLVNVLDFNIGVGDALLTRPASSQSAPQTDLSDAPLLQRAPVAVSEPTPASVPSDYNPATPPVARTGDEPPKQPARQWKQVGGILDIDELPPSLREDLPHLQLSGHLYSLARPNARKVILNGVALKEKQYLDDNLMIEEITPGGVILDFNGQLLRMSADRMFR